MLASPNEVVIGATDLRPMVEAWSAVGFERVAGGPIPAELANALYGLDCASAEIVLQMPGADSGRVRCVRTPHAHPGAGPFDRGPHAVDIYTTDMDRSIDTVGRAGANIAFGRLDYEFGPVHLVEGKTLFPDGLVVVFIDITRRRPSLLDADGTRLH